MPGPLGGVLVMVKAPNSVGIVRECLALQVDHIWLFKGLGGSGAVSNEAIELCHTARVTVVEGACPLMFLEPVGVPHRIHRGLRRLNGSLGRPAPTPTHENSVRVARDGQRAQGNTASTNRSKPAASKDTS